jgi:hypothetical protein
MTGGLAGTAAGLAGTTGGRTCAPAESIASPATAVNRTQDLERTIIATNPLILKEYPSF